MDDDQQWAQDKELDERAPKRSMMDRLRKAAPPEPSPDDAAEDVPGADAEADQRAIEDEFWNKK
jgi:hypothetical protein